MSKIYNLVPRAFAKSIPVFRSKRFKNPTLWGGTYPYLYSLYREYLPGLYLATELDFNGVGVLRGQRHIRWKLDITRGQGTGTQISSLKEVSLFRGFFFSYILLLLGPTTSLYRVSLNRGSTVPIHHLCCGTWMTLAALRSRWTDTRPDSQRISNTRITISLFYFDTQFSNVTKESRNKKDYVNQPDTVT